VLVVQKLVKSLCRHRGWIVGFTLRFLDDDFHLAPELAGVDYRVGVSIGLDVESLCKPRRREHGEVRGVVVDGVSVEISSARFRLFRDVADAAPLSPLEEHMLEGVGETALGIALVEVSRLHIGDDGNDGCRVVLLDEDRQAIGKYCAMNAFWIHCYCCLLSEGFERQLNGAKR